MSASESATADLLRSFEAFAALSDHDRAWLARYCEVLGLQRGAQIFAAGTAGEQAYVIVSGEVVVSTKDADGTARDLARYVTGEAFGELELFSNGVRAAAAYCSCDTRLLVFPSRGLQFPALLERHPELFARALHRYITVVASRIRAVTEQVAENSPYIRRLRMQMYRDKLTGSYNRAYLAEYTRAFAEPRGGSDPSGVRGAVVMIKPDNFKEINDTYGHEGGDAALRSLAEHITSMLPAATSLIRYRGNEFCVVCPELGAGGAAELAEKLRAGVPLLDFAAVVAAGNAGGTAETHSRRQALTITASIGIALHPLDGRSLEELTARAHETMFEVRGGGGDSFAFASGALQ